MTNSRRGVEAYGASKSLDAISPDFVNSFRWKNNSAPGCVGVVTLNPRTASILDERRRRREEQQQPSKQHRKEPIVIDHRGIVLSLPPSLFSPRASSFRKRVEGWPKVGGNPLYLLFALREKIIALLRGGESRVLLRSRCSWDLGVRRRANTWHLELHSSN